MLLNAEQLKESLTDHSLLVPAPHELEGEPSLTVHLASTLWKYKEDIILDSRVNNKEHLVEISLSTDGYVLQPGEFVLVKSLEVINMPENCVGHLVTRSKLAQIGIQSHLCSPHIDPGNANTITFEIKNNGNNPVRIYPEMPFAKLLVFEVSARS